MSEQEQEREQREAEGEEAILDLQVPDDIANEVKAGAPQRKAGKPPQEYL